LSDTQAGIDAREFEEAQAGKPGKNQLLALGSWLFVQRRGKG
jgi:hypothetical protein